MINLLLSLALSATSLGAAATEPPASTGTGQPAKPVAEAGRADNAPSAGGATN